MKGITGLVLAALLVAASVGLVACGGADDAGDDAATTSEESATESSGEPAEITEPANIEGTWSGTWYNMFSATPNEAWAEGTIEFMADGTYVSNFTPVTDEPPVEISEEFTIGTEGDRTTLTIHGRPYYAEITGDTLTLTEFSDDGTASEYPTFELTR